MNFESGRHGRCTNELRAHAKYTHKHVGVDWWCPRDVSRDLRCEIAILAKMHQNPSLSAHRIRSCLKPKTHFVSGNVTSISHDENSSQKNFTYQNLRNYAWGNSRASGGVWGGWHSPHFRQPTPISFGNFRKSCHALTPENQGTHSLYLALDCKCAFGAKSLMNQKISL